MARKFTKFPSNYVKSNVDPGVIDTAPVKVTKKLRREIYDYCDLMGGYSDYDQKIEDVMDTFGLTKEQAENEVWNWSINWQG